ncbi:elongation factor P 5-aminopentanone reductase [Aquibacillus albus]|uniref:3-oxoacyl-[acyl-carrier protein] reductase n=1 Tax=Aquibacillus albus TaxID=1168171 RepID=A0ABS2N1S1_9BACI|nr:SDR family oxidoreductase [Aquibacillus albus]MBM7572091.1 3-oxoacyl-[acyl-carrier protein] reductase [Aquibacillus albus]
MKRNCLVIGASGDIGVAIAKRLASDGYQLLLHYHENKKVLHQLMKQLPDDAVLGMLKGNLSTSKGIHDFLQMISFPINNVVFASGTTTFGLLQDVSENEMDVMFHLHVKTPWMISKHLLPDMIRQKYGNIIVISSIWGEKGASCEVIYSSVKGAQNSFVKSLAKELAHSGVSVNGVSPGFIETKMNENFTTEEKADIFSEIPMKRAGEATDVAHVVSFLLDERTSYVQGEIIQVTGGW